MGLQIETLMTGEMGTNCYLVWDDLADSGIIIDPADEGDYISQKIIEAHFEPQAIILTHGHFDHCLGLLEVKLNFKVPIFLAKPDWKLYRQARKNAKYFMDTDPGPMPKIDDEITEGQVFKFGHQELTALSTPGHTPGSISLTNSSSVVFTGDTLFKDGIGRTDFSYSSPDDLKNSIDKLMALPGWCHIYPGHGEASTIKDESLHFPS